MKHHISPTANAQDVTATYTPGPWVADRKNVVGYRANTGDQSDGMLVGVADVYGDNAFANARLIAAAPDLLSAIQGLLAGVYGDGYVLPAGDLATRRARAAIAKATAS